MVKNFDSYYREDYTNKNFIEVYNADFFEFVDKIEDNSIDLILTDPIWGIDYERVVKEFFRICKDTGSIVMFIFPDDIWKIKIPSRQVCVWKQVYSPQGRFTKKYRRFFTLILWWTKSENFIFNSLTRYQIKGVYEDFFEEFDEKVHPYQKPLSLIKKIIKIHSNENDLILDSFCGSGTTLLASKQLNRSCIGIEIDKNYCDLIKKRLERGY